MTIAYASPNKSHHFHYAEGLEKGEMLSTFVQGYPRYNKASLNIPREKISYRDKWQLLFIPFYRLLNESQITAQINLRSKNYIDSGLNHAMKNAQIGLFYNGCGLKTVRNWRNKNKRFICEAVNSHLDYQNELLREESKRLSLNFAEPYEPERSKRLSEYEECDYILCPSNFVANSFVHKGFSKNKLLINPFGLHSSYPLKMRPEEEKKPENFRILYVGSVNFRKGLRYLIEAFKNLKVSNKELWIVGPRIEPDGISDLSIPNGVTFKGVLKGDELSMAYKSADVFVQPSIEEGLSLVIGEALGFGLPVIATYNTGAEEIFKDAECGFHIPIRDSESITEKITQLVDQPKLREAMSKKAIEKSRNFGGWEKSQQNLCRLMKDILNSL